MGCVGPLSRDPADTAAALPADDERRQRAVVRLFERCRSMEHALEHARRVIQRNTDDPLARQALEIIDEALAR